MESYSYQLKYNINTKKLTDVFGNIMIRNKSLQKYHVVTNWGKLSDHLCCVLVGDTQKDADGSLAAENEIQDYYDCYRLDLQTGKLQELYHHVQIWSGERRIEQWVIKT